MKKFIFSRLAAALLAAVMLLGMLPLDILAADVTDFVAAPAGSENLALSATASASEDAVAAGATPAQINEGDRTWSLWRTATSLEGANDYYELTWDTPISVDQVVLFNQYSGQAPTAWKVLVTTGDDVWTEVAATENVTWSESTLEGKTLSFPQQNNVVALRVQIVDASLIWDGYTVYEIEVYNSGDADDNAVIAEDFVKVPDGFANYAMTAAVSTSSDVVLSVDLAQINDGDRSWAVSRTGTVGEDSYDFTWESAISVNQVVLFNQYSGQAPTAWKIFVTTDGSQWNEVAVTENVSWTESDLQGKVLKFQQQENVVGLRVQITDANMDWGHYCIYEVEIYDTADVQKDGYELYWNDEFNGTELDSTKWLNQYLPHATASEAGAMTDYEMADGVLTLKIDEDHPTFYDIESEQGFKVSSIQTYEKNWLHDVNARNVETFDGFRTQYGYFEVRYKMPACGGGGHVAFWMVGTQADARVDGRGSLQNGEIDVTETKFSQPNTHTPRVYAQDDPDLVKWSSKVELEGDYVNEWHTYGVDWTPEYLAFYVDGVEVARNEQSPQYEMCLLLGMYTNDDPDDDYWGGTANEVYPKEWEIDYVRVYKNENGYENGVTKPATPELLEGAVEVTNANIISGMENVAPYANVIASGDVVLSDAAELSHINNSNTQDSLTRLVSDLSGKTDFYQFEWENPVTVNQVVLYNQYAGQAPVAWEIFVTTDGQQWNKVAVTDNVLWSNDQLEGKALTFPRQKNITGLRLQVRKANLDWAHYCIYEVEIYDTHSAVEFPNLFENCNPGFDGALDENSMPELWTVQGNGSCGSYNNWGDMVTYLWKPAGGESFGMRSSKISVVPGELYFIELLVNGTGNACFYVEFWNAVGEQCETYYVTTRTLSENSWDGIGGSFTAPADAAYMGIQIRTEGEGEETIRFDDLYACVHTENYALSQLKRALEADDYAWTRNILSNAPCAFENVNEEAWPSYYLALQEVALEELRFEKVQQVIDQVNGEGSSTDVVAWSLTLGDDLGVSFLVSVEEAFVDQTYVNITVGDGEAVSYRVSDYTPDENGNYLFSANVAAAQMTDEVKLQTFVGDEAGEIHTYTVVQYAQTILADESMSSYHQLVKEMLNYGAAAQTYFGYHTENTIDETLYAGAGANEISAEGVADMAVSGSIEGISFYGASLLFRSKTAVRFYFTADGDISSYTFKLGEQTLTAKKKGGLYYVEVADINPQDLGKTVTLTVSCGDVVMTVAYGPMNYMVRMNEKGSDSLKALLKAMYNYYLAAEAM